MQDINMSASGKLLLTESETGEVLGLSRSTLRRLWAQGTIKPVHIGRALRYKKSEIERFVTELESEEVTGDGDE